MDAPDSREPSLGAGVGDAVEALAGWLRGFPQNERDAWGLALAVFGADVALTTTGLRLGLAEGNPLMATAIGVGGVIALVLAKSVVLVVAGLVRYFRPQDGTAIALGVALPWLLAVAINAYTIL